MIVEHIYIDVLLQHIVVLLSTVEIIFPKLRVKRVKYQDQSGDRHNLDHSKLFVWTNVTSCSVSLSVCLQSTSSTLPRQRGTSCETSEDFMVFVLATLHHTQLLSVAFNRLLAVSH